VPPFRGAEEHKDADATTEPYDRRGRPAIVKLDESHTHAVNRSDPSLVTARKCRLRTSTSTPSVPFAPRRPGHSTFTLTASRPKKIQSPVDFLAEMAESVVDMAESVVEATESLWLAESRGSNGNGAKCPARLDAAPGTGGPHFADLGVSRLSDFRNQSCALSPVHVTEPPAAVRSGSLASDGIVQAAASPGPATVDQRTVIESRRRRSLVAIALLAIALGVLFCLAAVLLGTSGHNRRPSVQRPFPGASAVSSPYHVVLPGVPHSGQTAVATGTELRSVWKYVAPREELPDVYINHQNHGMQRSPWCDRIICSPERHSCRARHHSTSTFPNVTDALQRTVQ
jgi:hypothetical protein